MSAETNRTPSSNRRRGLTWALMGAAGGAFFVVPWKLAGEAGESAHSALILLFVAALANTALVVVQNFRSSTPRFRITAFDLRVAGLLATVTLFGNLASARAIQDLSPALLNVLLRAEVLLVAVFAWVLLGERVERRFWFGSAIAVAGLVVLQGPLDEARAFGLFATGTGMAMLAALCFSALVLMTRYFIHRIDPVLVNALRLWIAIGFWFVVNPIPVFSELPRDQVLYAALAALAGPFFARLCLMISSRYIEARITVLTNLSAPILTLGLAYLILSDWPEDHQLIGGAIMMVGISLPLLKGSGFSRGS
jgi:drug/metabolite transporter (DMT)-like permease